MPTVNNSWHGSLIANVISQIDFNATGIGTLYVTNRSASSDIYAWSGSNPSVGGDSSAVIPPGTKRGIGTADSDNPEVRLITALAGTASVESYP